MSHHPHRLSALLRLLRVRLRFPSEGTPLPARVLGQPAGLLSVLLDSAAPFGDRLDAASDLAAYVTPEVIEALVSVASSPEEDPDVREECGSSIAEMWLESGTYSPQLFTRLQPDAQAIIIAYCRRTRPAWHAELSALNSNGAA